MTAELYRRRNVRAVQVTADMIRTAQFPTWATEFLCARYGYIGAYHLRTKRSVNAGDWLTVAGGHYTDEEFQELFEPAE